MSLGDPATDGFHVSSDVGGTFTDTVVIDASGVLRRYKAASTPGNVAGGVLATCELAGREQGLELSDSLGKVKLFSQGTTVPPTGSCSARARRSASCTPRASVTPCSSRARGRRLGWMMRRCGTTATS